MAGSENQKEWVGTPDEGKEGGEDEESWRGELER